MKTEDLKDAADEAIAAHEARYAKRLWLESYCRSRGYNHDDAVDITNRALVALERRVETPTVAHPAVRRLVLESRVPLSPLAAVATAVQLPTSSVKKSLQALADEGLVCKVHVAGDPSYIKRWQRTPKANGEKT